jgi:hypothetical protein
MVYNTVTSIIILIIISGVSWYVQEHNFTSDPRLNDKINSMFSFLLFIISNLIFIWKDNKLNIKALGFDNSFFVILFCLIILFTLYVLNGGQFFQNKDNNNRLRDSVRKAFVALIIAYYARLDLVIAPYILVLIFSFYGQKSWV